MGAKGGGARNGRGRDERQQQQLLWAADSFARRRLYYYDDSFHRERGELKKRMTITILGIVERKKSEPIRWSNMLLSTLKGQRDRVSLSPEGLLYGLTDDDDDDDGQADLRNIISERS